MSPGAQTVFADLGNHGEVRVAVVFPAQGSGAQRAGIYILTKGRWCLAHRDHYVRGSALNDRGGGDRRLRLINRHEQAVDLRWLSGQLAFSRGGRTNLVSPADCAP